jgi:hypothetical protein
MMNRRGDELAAKELDLLQADCRALFLASCKRHGSIKSNSGFPRSSATSRREAIFTSVTDLRRKLMRYIKHYNKTATPIRWSYADPSRRIA